MNDALPGHPQNPGPERNTNPRTVPLLESSSPNNPPAPTLAPAMGPVGVHPTASTSIFMLDPTAARDAVEAGIAVIPFHR